MNQIPNTKEEALQENVIDLLIAMGYIFIPRIGEKRKKYSKFQDISHFRGGIDEVLLKDVLHARLQELNSFSYKGQTYAFSPKNINNAIEDLHVELHKGLSNANQNISDMLRLGNSYNEELVDGVKKSFSFKYIDFENPNNNVFHFAEEFIVKRENQNEKDKTRRPDIVLFINGIPFGVIELKASSVESSQGISQMIRNQKEGEIRKFFKYIQITLAGNNHSPKYATADTAKKFYASWKEDNEEVLKQLINKRNISKLDSTIYALFSKSRVLEFINSFIIFDDKIKKIARYQQYFAVKEILKKINSFDENGKRQGGVIWHTQGSGKSLTMVMLTREIKKHIANSKIIVVTDRKDLDRQIRDTFKHSEIEVNRATSGKNLIELLRSGKSVITTVINKFETTLRQKIILEDENIFVLVDESHRTQSGDLSKAMRKTFPLSCYLGFTGTPLMKKEKSTFLKFQGLIHKYTIDEAVRDEAVLPLLYEGRFVDQWVNDDRGLQRKFDIISHDLNEEQKRDLAKKWIKFKKLASSEQRLEIIALDINWHFMKNFKGLKLKAILATSSKFEAIKYHKLFEEYANIKTAFVISPPDSKEGIESADEENKAFIANEWQKIIKHYGNEDRYIEKIKDKFINSDELDLLIVVDKLLTGFDAPPATVLYIDKELKEHNLLQAIARVNRLYEGKNFGFIVDFRGLLGDLDKALTSYTSLDGFDEQDLIGAVVDIREEIAKLKTFYSHLEEFFKSVENKNDIESYEVFLNQEEKRQDFYKLLSEFARALRVSLTSDKMEEVFTQSEIKNFKSKMKFYAKLRQSIKIRYHEAVDFGKYEKQMQKLLDTFISAGDVNELTKLVNIFDEEFESEIEKLISPNARADAILSATTATINEKKDSNPAYYEKIARRIQEILDAYKENRISEEEKLKQAKDIRDLLVRGDEENAKKYPKALKNNKNTIAFYDNLEVFITSKINDENVLQNLSLQINELFIQCAKKPDWTQNSDIKNQIEGQIEEMLWELEDKFDIKFENIDEMIAKIRNIGITNYA